MKRFRKAWFSGFTALSIALGACGDTQRGVTPKASHQWPGGKDDMLRDVMAQMIAEEAKMADSGLDILVCPGKSLYKPKEQWGSMVEGNLDITAFALVYAGGRHPDLKKKVRPHD